MISSLPVLPSVRPTRAILRALLVVCALGAVAATPARAADETAKIKARCSVLLEKFRVKEPQELQRSELQLLLNQTTDNAVTNFDVLEKYDPSGAIGFCFGRAYAAQIYAELAGVPKDRIRKLFVIGDMRAAGDEAQLWRFHVTTTVQGADGKWYALDPVAPGGKVLTADAWVKFVRRTWDRWHGEAPRTKFYFVHADAMLPDVRNYPAGIVGIASDEGGHAFDPLAAGLVADAKVQGEFGTDAVWTLDADQSRRYFLHLGDGENRFDFTQLTILGEKYRYANYFRDFVESVFKERNPLDPKKTRAGPRRGRGLPAAAIPLGFSPLLLLNAKEPSRER